MTEEYRRWQKAVLKNFNDGVPFAMEKCLKTCDAAPLKLAALAVVRTIQELFEKKGVLMSHPAQYACDSLMSAIKKAEKDHKGRCHDPFVCVDGVKKGCNQSMWECVVKTMEVQA